MLDSPNSRGGYNHDRSSVAAVFAGDTINLMVVTGLRDQLALPA